METEWQRIPADPESIKSLINSLNCHPVTATVLANRAILTKQDALKFLNPSFSQIRTPFSLKDMEAAVNRIVSAIENKEKILIFGDYDADGITSVALLMEFFQYIEADAAFYIPHRMTEGYGLKADHIRDRAVPDAIKLIITVDCGSSSHEAIEEANTAGIDVIVVDHHNIPSPAPPAAAVVNPKRPDCDSGLEHLAGVGLAFYLLICMRKRLRDLSFWEKLQKPEPNLKRYCDLVAIGTVADIAPIIEENRVFTRAGLDVMTSGYRTGANALIAASGIKDDYIDSEDIAYRLAPRINAAGRIDHANSAVDLLISHHQETAEEIAEELNRLNSQRQKIEKRTFKDISIHIANNPRLLEQKTMVLFCETWHEGVLGIVASQLARKFFRPVVLITLQNGLGRGSARSIPGFDLYRGLADCRETLEDFGGHAMAAGLSIKTEKIPDFKEQFECIVKSAVQEIRLARSYTVDAEIRFDMITDKLMDELEQLKPFGNGNAEPIFLAKKIMVVQSREVGVHHRRVVLKQKGDPTRKSIQGIWFNIDPSAESEDQYEEMIFHLRWNRWNGNKTVQFVIQDVKVGDSQGCQGKRSLF